MATKYWHGNYIAAEGDYSAANNWVPVNVPGAGDTVIIGAGSPSITAGLDQSGTAIANFYVEPGYTGQIGSAIAPLQLNCTTDIRYEGSGDAFIDTSSSQPDELLIRMPANATGTIHTKSGATGSSKEIVEAYLFRGRWEHHSGDFASVYVTHVDNILSDSTFKIWTCAFGTFYLYGGATEMVGGDITVAMWAGTFLIHNGDCDDISIYGGSVDWRTTNAAGTVTVYGNGSFDVSNDPRAKAVGTINAYGTPTLNLDNRNATYTAVNAIGDPTIIWPADLRTITIA